MKPAATSLCLIRVIFSIILTNDANYTKGLFSTTHDPLKPFISYVYPDTPQYSRQINPDLASVFLSVEN